MRRCARLSLVLLVLIGLSPALPGGALANDIDRAVVGAGAYNVLQDTQNAVAFDAEWRPGVRYFGLVAPFVGGFVTTRGSVYGYVGFGLDFTVFDRVHILPFTGASAYGRGDGKDLGSVLEFRSGLEVSYQFDSGSQLGISGFHLSNAGIGSTNPGVELLMLHYAVPIGSLF